MLEARGLGRIDLFETLWPPRLAFFFNRGIEPWPAFGVVHTGRLSTIYWCTMPQKHFSSSEVRNCMQYTMQTDRRIMLIVNSRTMLAFNGGDIPYSQYSQLPS